MGLLKRIYLFYKNVMDIYNIDFVTRNTYIKFPLTIFMLVCFIFTGAVIFNINILDYFNFIYSVTYILIYCISFLYLPFTSNKRNKIYESIVNNKPLNKYIIRPINYILTLNIKEKLTRAEYIIALIFIPAATIFTAFISYKIIQGLRYTYRFDFGIKFYGGDFYGATIMIYFAAVLLCTFIIIISSCILLILRLNDLINNNIINIVICIDMAIFITFLHIILDINYISTSLFLSFLIILFIIPAFFKSKTS